MTELVYVVPSCAELCCGTGVLFFQAMIIELLAYSLCLWLRATAPSCLLLYRMSALDAAWVNGGVPVCHTAGDVYLLLKSSDKVSSYSPIVGLLST